MLAIVALWAIIYIPGLFTPPLLDDADSVHAEAAREMVARHDWSTLYIDGLRYLEKAPLMYWGMGASYVLFGAKDWAARLPLALGVLALLLETYALGKRVLGQRAGLWAAVVLATSIGPYIFTRFLIPDMLVALWLTMSFDFFLRTLDEQPPSLASCCGLAAATALNVLTKGLIGLVFPALAIVVFLFLTGNWKHLARMRLLSSTLVFLLVAAPWHIVAALRNPAAGQARGFLWFYFVNEHFLRYLGKRIPNDYGTVPLLVFWALLLTWLCPWSAFLLRALAAVPHRWQAWRSALDRRQRALLLFGVWAGVVLLFFSFSTRQEYYSVPALPALALLTGAWLQEEEAALPLSRERRFGRFASWVLAGIGIIVFLLGMFLLLQSRSVPPDSDLAELLRKLPEEQYALSMRHVFDLTPRALGLFRLPLATFAIALLAGTLLNLQFRRRNLPHIGNWCLVLMMAALLLAIHQGLVTFSPILSSKKLADLVAQEYRPGDIVVANGPYEDASTLNFYLRQPLHIVNQRDEGDVYYGARFPDAPPIFENDDSLRTLWVGPNRVFLWSAEDSVPTFIRQSGSYLLGRSGGKVILMNRVWAGHQSSPARPEP